MSRIVALFLLLSLAVSACASNLPAPVATLEAETQSTGAVKTDFTPTEPKSVNLAAGKPQFVEFFAFW